MKAYINIFVRVERQKCQFNNSIKLVFFYARCEHMEICRSQVCSLEFHFISCDLAVMRICHGIAEESRAATSIFDRWSQRKSMHSHIQNSKSPQILHIKIIHSFALSSGGFHSSVHSSSQYWCDSKINDLKNTPSSFIIIIVMHLN